MFGHTDLHLLLLTDRMVQKMQKSVLKPKYSDETRKLVEGLPRSVATVRTYWTGVVDLMLEAFCREQEADLEAIMDLQDRIPQTIWFVLNHFKEKVKNFQKHDKEATLKTFNAF